MKKNAVKFLAVLVALAALSLPLLAQSATPAQTEKKGYGHDGQKPTVDQRVQDLTKALNLNDVQQAKVRSILENQHKQKTSLKQDTSLSEQDRSSKFQQMREDTHQKIRGVLNDDQKAKFDQMKADRKDHMDMHHGDMGSSDKH